MKAQTIIDIQDYSSKSYSKRKQKVCKLLLGFVIGYCAVGGIFLGYCLITSVLNK